MMKQNEMNQTDNETWRRVAERLEREKQALADATKGMIGLCQLVRNRDDISSEARQALTHNHRIVDAYEALSAAGIEDFQLSEHVVPTGKE